jgi:uncharacterized protein YdaU (DUF1376 family)
LNYYERHIGDYLKDTSHLSLLEHGVYTRLLDVYYTRESPLPANEVHRLIGARSKDEKAAVAAVLAEFFTLVDGTHRQERCDREISRFQDKQRKAKASAEARWSKSERNANAYQASDADGMRTHSEGNAPTHQTPDTSNQTPDKDTRTDAATSGARVCLALKRTGLSGLNPGHPDLLALIEAGATEAEFVGAALTAVERGKGFAYALGTLKRQRLEAAQAAVAMHRGPLPKTDDRKSRQLETAALMTGASRPRQAAPIEPETIDVASRILPA